MRAGKSRRPTSTLPGTRCGRPSGRSLSAICWKPIPAICESASTSALNRRRGCFPPSSRRRPRILPSRLPPRRSGILQQISPPESRMREVRLGDVIDDFCVKCKRIMNHSVVSMVGSDPAKVRCRTCYNDHDYRHEQAPPPKVDSRKAALFNEVLAKVQPGAETVPVDPEPAAHVNPKAKAKKK